MRSAKQKHFESGFCINGCKRKISPDLKFMCRQCGDEHQQRELARRKKYPALYLWKSAKAGAKRRNLFFNIEVTDVIIPTFCPIFGIPLITAVSGRTYNTPSIDRIIPELGYVKGNIRVISWRANCLRRDGTLAEFEALAKDARDLANRPVVATELNMSVADQKDEERHA